MKLQLRRIPLICVTFSMLLVLAGCMMAPGQPGTNTNSGITPTPPGITSSPPAPSTSPAAPVPSAIASAANGRRIYDNATSDSGESITYTGGPGMIMPVNLTCAGCHGPEGHGGTVHFMMQSYDVPNITWPELSGPDPDMQHPPYTESTLKRAITQGLDPGGNPLDYPMPRWQMSASDLNDLVVFIKTLK